MLARMSSSVDFVGGRFLSPEGEPLVSRNPARDGAPVLETLWSPSRVALAVETAKAAQPAWGALSLDERWAALLRFRAAIEAKKEELADAIVQEIGKIRSEARVEIQSLLGRFDLVLHQIKNDLRDGVLPGFPNEALRWHPHGVVAVIGPFNFPLHLCHAHVIPALLLGNTVVMKPSELAPLCGVRYAEAALAAGLPTGVLNVVHGLAATGAAVVAHRDVHALAFTGSWPVGRRIAEAVLDRPEMLIALEMGGKNTAIVCDDADLRQAAHEIVVGSYLTTGQRCTCTDRVLVTKKKAPALIAALRKLVSSIHYGDPDDARSFGGPLASAAGRDRLERAIGAAQAAGAEVIVEGKRLPGGFYRSASLHVLPSHDVPGYTDTELFGPDLGIEIVADDDEAIATINASPYGFANSIFTNDDARFDRYYRETRVGILNRNRSTNQASPRLPFGGTGRSGNFRPAGSFAPRNLAIPVAVQSNGLGTMTVLPALRDHLPAPELDELDAIHTREELEESRRNVIDQPRPLAIESPRGGAMPTSTRWLERFYAGDRTVREKKPGVFDHVRSHGSYYVSVDDAPLSVIDAMSQTATMPFGFNDDALVHSYVEGTFGAHETGSHELTHGAGKASADAYATVLRALVPGLPTVCFTACGAEANEKAYALCRANGPKQGKHLLAFDGSFHGRTLLSLYASHSPAKRVPFEIAGYEVTFAPFPKWTSPDAKGPREEAAFRALASEGDAQAILALAAASGDALLLAEAQSLVFVEQKIRTGEYFAVVIEPMQSEGGDRYATPRFHRLLRLLTRAHGVPLIMDEVQCGFGLGGHFAWHSTFDLVDAKGQPDTPDCVLFAKRAQVGVVLSRFADPEPTQAFPASLVRGRLHASLLRESDDAARVEELVRPHLDAVHRAFPKYVGAPRVTGFALAFDLPTPEHLNAYLNQRFWRGAIVFGAGDRTVRYRLHARFGTGDVETLFTTVRQSLAWLEAHGWGGHDAPTVKGKMPPEWDDVRPAASATKPHSITVREPTRDEIDAILPKILELEAKVYEPARRDPEHRLAAGFRDPDGVVVVAERPGTSGPEMVGYAIAIPLESVPEMHGPDRDPHRGRHDTAYSVALTVDPSAQGGGLGQRLKHAQLVAARAKKKADGSPRYAWMVGRNRVGHADAMSRVNDRFGAYTVYVLDKQYEDEAGIARYYRQPLQALRASGGSDEVTRSIGGGLVRPFTTPPASLRALAERGALAGPTVNKITICNYITPAIARATEWAAATVPALPHVFSTSGRDETIDKSIRMLRWHRKKGQKVIGLAGGYVGHTTAAARSLSCPSTHRQGAPHFAFPRVPHPEAGVPATIAALDAIVADGGADAVLGLYVETVQERTGAVLPDAFFEALEAWRAKHGVPVVLVETASSYYRSGRGAFASSSQAFVPDALVWWTGGQQGYVHVASKLYVPTPLTFVSTWDGDELSMIHAHHQLRAARSLDLTPAIAKLDDVLGASRIASKGLGLYRVLHAGERADDLVHALGREGLYARAFAQGGVAIAPALDTALTDIDSLARALA